ncbi:MAG TPA: DUF5989 family protein [Drouetiella sp.]
MTNSTYLTRLHDRRETEELKATVIFGLALGWVLTLMGAFRYFFLVQEHHWLTVCQVGLAILAVTVIMPGLIGYPQRLIQKVGGFVATQVFKVLIAILYFVVVLPIGLIAQKTSGTHPFYSWTDTRPANTEGWVDKNVTAGSRSMSGNQKSSMMLNSLHAFRYFTEHGQLILLPCLVLFLVLGLMGVLVQSSAIAPLIYTLF